MIYKLKGKDINKLLGFISEEEDIFKEWYITINNKRKFLYNPKVLDIYFRKIKHGEILLSNYNANGFIFTWGISEKSYRRYIKIIANNTIIAFEMLQEFLEKYGKNNWYVKIKKDNPLKELYLESGFVFKGGRGKEILLAREVI